MTLRIFTVFLICAALNVSAQQADTKKSADKPKAEPVKIDYHAAGTAMPPVKLVSIDTFANNLDKKALKKLNKHNKRELGYAPITQIYTEKDLDNGAPLLMMLFNPTCGHCEQMTDMLTKNLAAFKNAKLVLVATPANKTYLHDFVKNHKVRDFYPNVIIGVDSSSMWDNTYLYSSLPQINIYSKDRKLVKMYNGEIAVDSLKKYMEF